MMKVVKTLAVCWLLNATYANALIIGTATPNTGNCFPLGCDGWGPEYQQVYDASAFSGAFDIHSLSFYNTVFDSFGYETNDGIYSISLSTTSAAVDGLSTTFANNVGADDTLVYQGALDDLSAFGDQLNIMLDSLFSYDPGQGNLLMRVTATGVVEPFNRLFFDQASSASDAMSRGFRNGGVDSNGLVTGFNEVRVAVPEPTSILLMALGALALGRVRRR